MIKSTTTPARDVLVTVCAYCVPRERHPRGPHVSHGICPACAIVYIEDARPIFAGLAAATPDDVTSELDAALEDAWRAFARRDNPILTGAGLVPFAERQSDVAPFAECGDSPARDRALERWRLVQPGPATPRPVILGGVR